MPASLTVLGLISGTSLDAIDVAASRFTQNDDVLTLETLGHAEHPWPKETRQRLLAALPPAPTSLAEICALDVLVGGAFADVARNGLAAFAPGADLVASHGQTVFHWVEGTRARGTLQLGQPAIIAEATGLPVVSDLRARDVAAGGQGAPLASTLDRLWLAGPGGPRAALNLGGIANITVVGGAEHEVLAFDTGPASCLLDLEAARLTAGRLSCDVDGRLASAGTVRPDLLHRFLADPFFALPPPKSTGREHFDRDYVARHTAGLPDVDGRDLMATLVELTARTVADACRRHGVREVVASGGGTNNPALVAALRAALGPCRLVASSDRGLPPDAKEAYLFALLGYLAWMGVPASVPAATGAAGPRLLGSITPGRAPLALPAPLTPPKRLLIT